MLSELISMYCLVKFEGSYKEYAYMTFMTDIKIGDTVIVEANTGMAFAKFQGYTDYNKYATKYVIAKVDSKYIDAKSMKRTAAVNLPQCFNHRSAYAKECGVCEIRDVCNYG